MLVRHIRDVPVSVLTCSREGGLFGDAATGTAGTVAMDSNAAQKSGNSREVHH